MRLSAEQESIAADVPDQWWQDLFDVLLKARTGVAGSGSFEIHWDSKQRFRAGKIKAETSRNW